MKEDSEDVILVEKAVSADEIRAELLLTNVSQAMAGLYTCVAINSAGVSADSTTVSVVHLSFIYRFSWEFWFLVLLSFVMIFFIFVGVIFKTICRQVHALRLIIIYISLFLEEEMTKSLKKRTPRLRWSFNMRRRSSGMRILLMAYWTSSTAESLMTTRVWPARAPAQWRRGPWVRAKTVPSSRSSPPPSVGPARCCSLFNKNLNLRKFHWVIRQRQTLELQIRTDCTVNRIEVQKWCPRKFPHQLYLNQSSIPRFSHVKI